MNNVSTNDMKEALKLLTLKGHIKDIWGEIVNLLPERSDWCEYYIAKAVHEKLKTKPPEWQGQAYEYAIALYSAARWMNEGKSPAECSIIVNSIAKAFYYEFSLFGQRDYYYSTVNISKP